jgi:hypothetical protein
LATHSGIARPATCFRVGSVDSGKTIVIFAAKSKKLRQIAQHAGFIFGLTASGRAPGIALDPSPGSGCGDESRV